MNGLRMRILKINESVDDVVWICRGRSRSRVAVISDSIYKTDRVWKRCTSVMNIISLEVKYLPP